MTVKALGKLVVVGQGYVGLSLAMRAVEVGYDVVGYDVDDSRVKRLAAGESYVEDVDCESLLAALTGGRYRSSSEARACAGFDVAVITVPTPLREGNPDLSYIESSALTLARFVRPGSVVVVESTTYPGTTEDLVAPILEEGSGLSAGVASPTGHRLRV
jgi:UDP-N-acetyl-D-glucosamine dehydrogenase